MCVWMLRNGRSKKDVERYVRDEYGLLPKFAPFSNPFDETCVNAVPVSVSSFLNSADFEEAMYGVSDRENPYKDGDKALFWDYEKTWLDMFVDESQTLIKYRDEYVKDRLLDFEGRDGVPTTLKASLYSRYLYWTEESPAGFEKCYKEQYLS